MTYLRTFSALLLDPMFIVPNHTACQYHTLETLIQQYVHGKFFCIFGQVLW